MSVAWTPDRRAESLVPQRADLIRRLQLVVPRARHLTEEERELVVDEALTYVVVEYESEIGSASEAEEVFWVAAKHRVARAAEGRNDTVRGGFERTSDEELADVEDKTRDPADLIEQSIEMHYVAEFAASLDRIEGQVLRAKWLTNAEPVGYRKVAEQLAITPARARAAERAIASKLDRFATLCAAGRLCAERSEQIVAIANGADDRQALRVAKAHIKHCAACKMDYVAQLRAVRSAEFQRQVASVLPAAPLGEAARRHGGAFRDFVADWVGRLGGSDAMPYAAHTAASGIGRGAGGVLAVKIVAVLVGGAALVGGTVELFDQPDKTAPKERPAPARSTPTPKPSPRPAPKPTVTAAPKHANQRKASRKSKTQGGTGSSSHERAVSSDAPAGSQPSGASEFTPDSANLGPAQPAPVSAAPGASEFP